MFRYFFSTLFLGFFLLYWLTTLTFVLPDNYINISLSQYSEKFNTFFFQSWSFFAPPPKSNDRLYYIFEDKTNKSNVKVFEVIEPILEEKTKNAPLNYKEDLLDYILSNSINSIIDEMVNSRKLIDYECKKNKTSLKESDKYDKIKKIIQHTNSFKTITNYSKYVAKENNLIYENYNISIKISQKLIPKFSNRNKKINNLVEEIYFDSQINIQNDKVN